MTRHVLILALASAFLTAGAYAQKKTEPAANSDSFFSSDSRLVLIDTIVTDKNGAPIRDLTHKNFKVREDGKKQAVSTFSYLAGEAPDTAGEKHYLVLLFDNTTMARIDQRYARNAAMKFIESNSKPGRLMATVEFGGALRVTQNLTDDMVRLKQAVNDMKLSITSADSPGSPGNYRRAGDRSADGAANALPEGVRNLAKALAAVPGRKTIILFSEGLNASADRIKAAVEECNRANVAIYPVDISALAGRGLDAEASQLQYATSGGPMAPVRPGDATAALANLSVRTSGESLYGLAKNTGGFVVSSPGKLSDEINRIGEEQNQYYVLGYLPVKESQPGACHSIKVEVDRAGANVRARNSYCDEKSFDIQTSTPGERDLEARLNANATSTVQATMQAPFFYVAPNTARVDLALDIPGDAVKFVKDKGKFAAALHIIGIAYLPDGGVAARFSDIRKIALDNQQQVDDFASRQYHFEKQFEMAAGKFDLKVAFSSAPGNFGKAEAPLTIDPWEPSKFLLSGLALSQSTRPATAAVLAATVDLFGDQVPLVFKGAQIIPAGTNRLRESEKAYIYAQIYEPALSASVDVQLTLLDAKTGKLVKDAGTSKVTRETTEGAEVVPVGIVIPVSVLGPGSYTAQVTAQDAAGNRFSRSITFELEP